MLEVQVSSYMFANQKPMIKSGKPEAGYRMQRT
jgi:hypothetical protein